MYTLGTSSDLGAAHESPQQILLEHSLVALLPQRSWGPLGPCLRQLRSQPEPSSDTSYMEYPHVIVKYELSTANWCAHPK